MATDQSPPTPSSIGRDWALAFAGSLFLSAAFLIESIKTSTRTPPLQSLFMGLLAITMNVILAGKAWRKPWADRPWIVAVALGGLFIPINFFLSAATEPHLVDALGGITVSIGCFAYVARESLPQLSDRRKQQLTLVIRVAQAVLMILFFVRPARGG